MSNIFIKKGDLVVFDDKHKIYCGDSTEIDSFRFIDKKAVLTLTSPPYNVGKNNYGNGGIGGQKYQSKKDDMFTDEDYLTLLNKSLTNGMENSEYVFFNVGHTSGNKQSLLEFLYNNRYYYVDTIIWAKDTTLPAIEPNVLNSDFEYIFVFKKDNYENHNNTRKIKIGHDFRGTQSNVLKMPRNTRNEYAKIHSALMPLHLVEYIIKTFSQKEDAILDTFSGLGSTFVGCLLNDRTYYGVELEPFYVQETIKRFLEYDMGSRNIYIIRNGKRIEFNEFKDYVLEKHTSIFDFS